MFRLERIHDATGVTWLGDASRGSLTLERHVRDARMFTISGGTAQILRTQVASTLLGMKLPQTRNGHAATERDPR